MTTLEKIGQGLVGILLLILGLPAFCIYGLYVGIYDLIDVIKFYYNRK
jgi:hypothetical protein